MSHDHDEHPPIDDRSTNPEDDTVARLLRLAGHRPPVPELDAAIVKRAVRVEWRETVARQRRRTLYRRGGIGLLAAAAVLLLFLGGERWRGAWPLTDEPIATLAATTGRVTAWREHDANAAMSAGNGDALWTGAAVETAAAATGEPPARAALRLADGTSLRLDADSRIRLAGPATIALERGSVYVDTGEGPPRRALEVHTPLGIARDIGTQFEVRLDDGGALLRVRVREGLVALDHDGDERTVAAGTELTATADGRLSEAPISVHGSRWDWVVGILPALDVEGIPLNDLLRWAAREKGWELRYAEPGLEQRAAATVLHGSITGLAIEDAVAGMITASGLDYRLDDGELVVASNR